MQYANFCLRLPLNRITTLVLPHGLISRGNCGCKTRQRRELPGKEDRTVEGGLGTGGKSMRPLESKWHSRNATQETGEKLD